MSETSFFVAPTNPYNSQSPETSVPVTEEANVYEDPKSEEIRGEAERLRALSYPSLISEQLLGRHLQNRILVDVGAGSNTDLYDFSVQAGATYVPIDIHQDFLAVHREGGGIPVVADIDNLPFLDNSINISHARFVLSWLAEPEKRERAIRECLRIASERTVFLDYDWTAMDGDGPVLALKDVALEILMGSGFDPYYGKKLLAEVTRCIDFPHTLHVSRNNEGVIHDVSELLKMGEPLAFMARQRLNRPDLAQSIEERVRELGSQELSYTRPDIVAVEVAKDR